VRDELDSTVSGQHTVNTFCGKQYETSGYRKEVIPGQVNEYQLLKILYHAVGSLVTYEMRGQLNTIILYSLLLCMQHCSQKRKLLYK